MTKNISKSPTIDENFADMHVHTRWCNHSTNTIEDIFNLQKSTGHFIAINEHLPLPLEMFSREYKKFTGVQGVERTEIQKRKINGQSMLLKDLPNFFEDYNLISQKFNPKDIVLGFEVDYTKGLEEQITTTLMKARESADSFGVNINHFSLAVHYYKGEMMWTTKTMNQILAKEGYETFVKNYFENIFDGMKGKIEGFKPDFVCHPGIIHFLLNQANHFCNMSDNYKRQIYYEAFRNLLNVAKEEDIAIEVNTSGYDRQFFYGAPLPKDYYKMPFDFTNPHFPTQMLREAIEKDVKLVLSSDNHHNGQEFRHFDETKEMLVSLEATKLYKIVNHEKIAIDLE
jgi:HisJ family histidinol phosphate phosphatase